MPPLPVVQSAADALFLSFTLELFDTPALPVVLASCLAAMKPGGRIVTVSMACGTVSSCLGRIVTAGHFVTVSMARSGGGLAVRLYEWMHAHYPRTVDCRPIDAAALLACAGFTLVSVEQRSLCGLPIEVVLVLAPG
jgi:demethylmenaquinone methyltransferase/2-methoxy-6-polyprenyl-1,4-benzoquinol methylase